MTSRYQVPTCRDAEGAPLWGTRIPALLSAFAPDAETETMKMWRMLP